MKRSVHTRVPGSGASSPSSKTKQVRCATSEVDCQHATETYWYVYRRLVNTFACLLAKMLGMPAASLPIFNRGKRPRQALLTHPNNVDGVSSSQEQRRQDSCWDNSSSCSSGQVQPRWDQPRSAMLHALSYAYFSFFFCSMYERNYSLQSVYSEIQYIIFHEPQTTEKLFYTWENDKWQLQLSEKQRKLPNCTFHQLKAALPH